MPRARCVRAKMVLVVMAGAGQHVIRAVHVLIVAAVPTNAVNHHVTMPVVKRGLPSVIKDHTNILLWP